MTEDEKKLAAYLYNTLNGGSISMPVKEAEIMALAKAWLKRCTEPEEEKPLKAIKKDANATAS